MSSEESYIPEKYITIDDAFDFCGIADSDQANLTEEERNRFGAWVREANDKVEASLFPDADVIPLEQGTAIYTYAKDAALNWVLYKKRNLTGSTNAKESKQDYNESIRIAQTFLKRQPTSRNLPIQTPDHTDSLDDYVIPYSQTQGYPPDTLY